MYYIYKIFNQDPSKDKKAIIYSSANSNLCYGCSNHDNRNVMDIVFQKKTAIPLELNIELLTAFESFGYNVPKMQELEVQQINQKIAENSASPVRKELSVLNKSTNSTNSYICTTW